MGGVEGCADRSPLHPEDLRDPRVIEVGVIAKEDHEPLPFGQSRNRVLQTWQGVRFARTFAHLLLRYRYLSSALAENVVSGVDHNLGNPSIERHLAPIRPNAPQRTREPVLQRIPSKFAITGDRPRQSGELLTPRPIQTLKLPAPRLDPCHEL